MTVSPRYSNYTDVRDTGVQLPIQLPLDLQQQLEMQRQQQQQQQQELTLQQQQQEQQRLQQGLAEEQQQPPVSAATAEDVAAAAAVYQRSETAATGGCSGTAAAAAGAAAAGAAGGGGSLGYVRYFMCCSAGVDRVFVDHPLYNGSAASSSGGALPWPAGVLSTYCHPPGSIAAARHAPDLAAAASVLCQAAVAAPVLLWGLGHKLEQQQQREEEELLKQDQDTKEQQQQQVKLRQQRRQLRQEWALLQQLLGRAAEQQAALDALTHLDSSDWNGSGSSSNSAGPELSEGVGSVSVLLSAAASEREARLAAELQHPQQLVSGVAQPVLLGTAGSEVDRRWAVSDLLLPQQHRKQQQQQQARQRQQQQQQQAGPVIFVANDWPCGVLPLWLQAYREVAAEDSSGQQDQQQRGAEGWQAEADEPVGQQQQGCEQELEQGCGQEEQCEEPEQLNPYADWLLQQQAEVISMASSIQQQQQQQQQQQLPSSQQDVASGQGAAGAAGDSPVLSRDSSSSSGVQRQPGWVSQAVAADAAGGQWPTAQDQHTTSLLQHSPDSIEAAAGSQLGAQQPQGDDGAQAVRQTDSSSSSSLLLSDESAADAWLADTRGYSPASVHNRRLTAALSDAIAAGRVPPERLPAVLAGQSQLQLLLAQEELLGLAIERLKLSTVNVNQLMGHLAAQQQQQQEQQQEDARSNTAAAAERQQQQQLPPVVLPHSRQLQLLQPLLGRQLADARVVFAIHNYGYQGIFKGRSNFDRLGLPGRMLSAFVSPLARAAAKAAAAAGAASGAAVSAVSSQLAALAGVLQHLAPEPHTGNADSSSSSSSSGGDGRVGDQRRSSGAATGHTGLGLFSSLQAMLGQEHLDATAAALAQAEAADSLAEAQQQEQEQQQPWASYDGDEGSLDDAELLEGLHGVLAAAATHTGWEQPQENRSPRQQQQQQQEQMREEQQVAHQTTDPQAAYESAVDVNWLRAGLCGSDLLVTVSEGYAQELLAGSDPSGATNPELQALMASKGLSSVLNGLDTDFWNPARDPLLPSAVRYGPDTAAGGKAAAKQLLQRRLGLAVDPAAPLFVFVGRLTLQKGVDVILAALPQLLRTQQAAAAAGRSQWAQKGQQAALSGREAAAATAAAVSWQGGSPAAPSAAAAGGGLQFALLGNGERWMEDVLGQLDGRYPGRAVGIPAFNEPLAHLLMAAADFLLVPSRFEPCGLVALAGLRYGAVPLGTATGGLGDVVTPSVGYRLPNPGPEGDTAAFRKAVGALVGTVQQAAGEYGSEAFRARRAAAMAVDVSWEKPCSAWEELLQQLVADGQRGQTAAANGSCSDSAAGAAAGEGPGAVCVQQLCAPTELEGTTLGVAEADVLVDRGQPVSLPVGWMR